MRWLEEVLVSLIIIVMLGVIALMVGCSTTPMYDVDLPGYVKPVYALNSGIDSIGLKLKACP